MVLEAEVEDPLAKAQLHAKIPVLLRRSQGQLFPRHRPDQETFAQVGPLVGRLGLISDQSDLALEAAVAKAEGDRIAGRAGAYDYRFRSRSRSLRRDQAR